MHTKWVDNVLDKAGFDGLAVTFSLDKFEYCCNDVVMDEFKHVTPPTHQGEL